MLWAVQYTIFFVYKITGLYTVCCFILVYIYRAVSGRIQGTVSGLPPQFRLNTPRQALLQMQ
jgi:hypothetical protein